MPRRRPGAIRVAHNEDWRTRAWADDKPTIDRLSGKTSAAIHVVEETRGSAGYHSLRPGTTAQHLADYRAFLRQEGRLELTASLCPACPGCWYEDIAEVRDALEAITEVLPSRARGELRRVLATLDAQYRRRTLPDLDPARWRYWDGTLKPWWHRRMYANLPQAPTALAPVVAIELVRVADM
jgi:hypothetical protein